MNQDLENKKGQEGPELVTLTDRELSELTNAKLDWVISFIKQWYNVK